MIKNLEKQVMISTNTVNSPSHEKNPHKLANYSSKKKTYEAETSLSL